MGDDNNAGFGPADENEEEEVLETELDALKLRAQQMGIKHHPNIGVDKLKEKINEVREAGGVTQPEAETESETANTKDAKNEDAVEATETKAEQRTRSRKEASRLRRVRITCMNPMKSEWEGEIFTCGNGVVGNFKKYVPFDVEWHVPQIILNMIEARKYQSFYTVRDKRTGQSGRKGKIVKEFSVEILPDLTEAELKALAQRQAMARGTAEA